MRAIYQVVTATCFSLSILGGDALAASPLKQYSVRDFFRNPEQSGFQISPNGKYISFMQPWKGRMNIFVRTVGSDAAPLRITSEEARDISGYFWKGDDHILFAKDFGGDENFHVVSVGRDGKGLKDLTPYPKVRAQIVDDLEDNKDEILVSHNKRDPEVFDVYRVNVKSGAEKLVAKNPGNIQGWITDHDGKVRAATTSDGVNTSLLYRATESAPFKTVLTTSFKDSVDPLFFTFDNKKLYVSSNLGRDKKAIVILDPETAKEEQLLYENPEVDVEGLAYSKKRKVLTEISYTTWKTQYKFLDTQSEALHKTLQEKLPGYEVITQSHTKDESTWIVAAYNDRTQGSRYLFDSKSGTLTKLADINPAIAEKDMAEMKPVQYKARDGLVINGYLTLPLGKDPKNLPVIVNPHGGPWVRDVWGYNPEVQLLANRGYAVLQMNYRGSTGYGRQFWEASFKQWGKTMQDDITDGVQWLVQQGIADPKRVAIYGGSYGGYATLAGVTFTPDLYAAAVDYVGVSNMFTFMKTIPPYWKPFLDQMYEMVGDPVKDKELLTAVSPALHTDRIKTPLFVAQGANDPRVNKAESDQIVESLRKRGVPVEYMVKDNEGHGFHNEENRFDFYTAMEGFLAKHLAPK
ncbi:MAG: putative peptidase [Collimonas fungivorans]|uniref:S9 family peptidase n=1 Tax=Collimonas fungivorans TaxID=158899 RepID=UPI0026F0FC90|nr:S9 family peptidase [Collimonas fungivorans]MDB5767993.1 putative peptidase [Collimonas fungivorans]